MKSTSTCGDKNDPLEQPRHVKLDVGVNALVERVVKETNHDSCIGAYRYHLQPIK